MTRRQLGFPGHFCAARSCRFHIVTQIGDVLISTIGAYEPEYNRKERKGGFEEIGLGRYYETYVFNIDGVCDCSVDCGMPKVTDWSEIDGRGYQTAAEATLGHEEMCQKYESGSVPVNGTEGEEE